MFIKFLHYEKLLIMNIKKFPKKESILSLNICKKLQRFDKNSMKKFYIFHKIIHKNL